MYFWATEVFIVPTANPMNALILYINYQHDLVYQYQIPW